MSNLEELIQEINILARKSKTEGLTESEKNRQAVLREEYLAIYRRNLRAQLELVEVVDENGNIVKPMRRKRTLS